MVLLSKIRIKIENAHIKKVVTALIVSRIAKVGNPCFESIYQANSRNFDLSARRKALNKFYSKLSFHPNLVTASRAHPSPFKMHCAPQKLCIIFEFTFFIFFILKLTPDQCLNQGFPFCPLPFSPNNRTSYNKFSNKLYESAIQSIQIITKQYFNLKYCDASSTALRLF